MHKNFAIIGCGRIGCRHAEQIIQWANVKAVCDIVPAKADELAALYNATPYYRLEDLLLAELNLDTVSICTPNGLHATHTIKSLGSGINVFKQHLRWAPSIFKSLQKIKLHFCYSSKITKNAKE